MGNPGPDYFRFMYRRVTTAAVLGALFTLLGSCESGGPTSPKPSVTVLTTTPGLQVTPPKVTLHPGESSGLFAVVISASGVPIPPESVRSQIRWSSADPSVATITDGLVTGGSPGTTIVRASYAELPVKVVEVWVLEPLAFTASSLPNGTAQAPYSQTLTATGGNGTYTWSAPDGLPAGLSMDASTGVISGAPTGAGTYFFTVSVSSAGDIVARTLSLSIHFSALQVTTASLPNGQLGTAYGQVLSATGGSGTYTWTVTGGALPAGLTLDAGTGQISGAPLAPGAFGFTVQVTSVGQSAAQTVSLNILSGSGGLEVMTTSLPNGQVGMEYSQALAAAGGSGSYAWAITAGALPSGLTFDESSGLVSGTPGAAGTFNFTARVTSAAETATRAFTVTIAPIGGGGSSPPPPPPPPPGPPPPPPPPPPSGPSVAPVVTTATLPGGAVGTAYSQTLAATGGSGTYTWAITAGTLPAGLALNASTGVISGIPTLAGFSSFTVQVTSAGQTDTQALGLIVGPALAAPNIATTVLPNGTRAVAYSQALAASGGSGTYVWAMTLGGLPAGLTLGASTGRISGTPTTAGTSNFTVQVTSAGQTDTQALSITIVQPAPNITTSSLPNGTQGVAYNQPILATGGNGTFAWAISSGALPAGITLNAGTGQLGGTPTGTGTASFTVQATSASQTDTQALSITIAAAGGGLANECQSQSPAWIWCDDFDVDRLSSYFEVDNASGNFSRVAGVGQSGSFGMQGTFQNGANNAGSLKLALGLSGDPGYVDPVDGGVLKYRDVYWRMFVRTQAGWTGGGADKLSRAAVLASSTWAEAAVGHVWTPNSAATNLMLDPVRGTDAAGNLLTTTYNDFAHFTWLSSAQGTTNLFSSANANTWHCVEAHMRLNDAGVSNGVFELRVNGNLEGQRNTLNWLGAYSSYGINAIFFENFWNDGSPQVQSRYFDNIVVSTEPIGCTGGTPGGPNPVAVVQISGGTTVQTGSTLNLAATQKDKTNATVAGSVTWASTDTGKATVNSSGVVTGIVAGTTTITAVSSNGKRASVIVTVTAGAAPPQVTTITTTSLPSGQVGILYNRTLAAVGGNGSYSWAVTLGTLSAGLVLNPLTGQITGIPLATGTVNFTVQVTSGAQTDTQALSISIGSGGGGGGGPAPIRDVDFEAYSTTSALKSDCTTFNCGEDENTSVIVLDTSVAPPIAGLTKSMRYDYLHEGDGCNSITIKRTLPLPSPQQEIWAEFYVRWSANFTTANNNCSPNDHKLIFADTQGSQNGRWAFYVGNGGGSSHAIRVERPTAGGGTGDYALTNDGGKNAEDLWDGDWHVIRLHLRSSTTQTSGDGMLQVWIDGALRHNESGFNVTRSESGPDRIEGFSFAHNKDDGPAGVLMSLWWGRIQVFDQDPGW